MPETMAPMRWPGRRRVARGVGLALGILVLLTWTLAPFYWLFVHSLLTKMEQLGRSPALFPRAPSLGQFSQLLQLRLLPPEGGLLVPGVENARQFEGWVNSLVVGLAVVPLTLAVAVPAAYAFGRLRFRHRTPLLVTLVLTRAYPPISVAIPFTYLFLQLGINGTLSGLAVAHLSLTVPLVTWIMTGFFAAIPRSLEASARLDGLTRFQALVRVLLRLARPGLVAYAMVAFLTSWNEYFFALALTSGTPAETAPLAATARASAPAFILVTLLPPLALALMFQRAIRSMNIVNPL
jgi:multiple sugar transport system permease protein